MLRPSPGTTALSLALSALSLIAAACASTPERDAGASAPSPDPTTTDEVVAATRAASPTPREDATPESAGGAADALHWELLIDGLDVPNDLADIGDGRLLVSDQTGLIHMVTDEGTGDEPVLDLTDRIMAPTRSNQELGLSGFTLHPQFATNRLLYVFYTAAPEDDTDGVRRVDVLAEFTAAADEPLRVEPDSERELMRTEQAGMAHVGGHMAFADDGMLYVGMGDSGRPAEAADPHTMQGTIIRIDVDGDDGYAVPADNPFADGRDGAPEVFAYGFRNPFRLAWDDTVGLLVAEPQWQEKHQEVHVAVSGGDHGYPATPRQVPDGSCFDRAPEPLPECLTGPEGEPLQPPVLDYDRTVGNIVSGVAVSRGDGVPGLGGAVVVADWGGTLLAATPGSEGEQWETHVLEAEFADGPAASSDGRFTGYVWALDADASGAVYAMTTSRSFAAGEGAVYRLSVSD